MNTNFFRRTLTILTLVALSVLPMWAQSFTVDGINYQVTTGNEVKVTGGQIKEEIIIPETVTYNNVSYSVTCIGQNAFSGRTGSSNYTKRYVLPSTIRQIERSGFYDNYYAEEIVLNEGLETIGEAAFGYNYVLKEIILPSTVTSIGSNAFIINRSSNINIYCLAPTPPSIQSNSFQGRINQNKLYVRESSFETYQETDYWKEFTSYETVPDNVLLSLTAPTITWNTDERQVVITAINDGLTIYYTLDGSLPTEESTLYSEPFAVSKNCIVKAIAVNEEHQTSIVRTSLLSDIVSTFYYDGVYYKPIESNPYGDEVEVTYGKKYTGDITIPETVICYGNNYRVVGIGQSAFSECSGLTSVTIPNTVTSISNNAFYNCDALKQIEIPSSVQTIGQQAFYSCGALQEVALNEGLQTIGYRAFEECRKLSQIEIPSSVEQLNERAFYNCTALQEITFQEGLQSIGSNAFRSCTSLKSIQLPESLTSIGTEAFRSCSSLSSVKLPSTLTVISDLSFDGTGITTIEIPNSVQAINYSAFGSCPNLTSIIIPEGITTIARQTFNYCRALTSITLPSTLTSIGNNAFYECTSLPMIALPESLTSIGSSAFVNCNSLKDVYCMAKTPPSMANGNAFDGIVNNATLYVPSNVKETYQTVLYWAEFSKFGDLNGSPCAQPTFTYENGVLAISSLTDGASIYYTTDETDPSNTSTLYTKPIQLSRNCIVKAIAISENHTNSPITEYYVDDLTVATPVVTVSDDLMVTITCETPDIQGLPETTIMYVYDYDGNWEEKKYDGPFKLTRGGMVSTWALRDGWNESDGADYDLYEYQVEIPNITWNSEEKLLHIEHNDSDVIIYYTLDGTIPSVNSNRYSEPIALTKNVRVKAFATKLGRIDSEINERFFTKIVTNFNVDNIIYALTGNMIDEVIVSNGGSAAGDVIIPKVVTYMNQSYSVIGIAAQAFAYNYDIQSIILPNTINCIEKEAFRNCTALTEIEIPESVVTIGDKAFQYSGLNQVLFHEGLQSIGESAFAQEELNSWSSYYSGRASITTPIVFPKTLRTIGAGAFNANIAIPQISFQEGLESIGTRAFQSCYAITQLVFPSSLKKIDYASFGICRNLQSVEISNGTEEIDGYAFWQCYALSSVIIPESMIKIGGLIFQSCTSLKKVYCFAKTPPLMSGETAFPNIQNNITLYVLNDAIEKYRTAENWSAITNVQSLGNNPCNIPKFNYNNYWLTVTSKTEGADIYYTTDGTEPSESSQLYTEPIPITRNCTIRAVATHEGCENSLIADYQVIGLTVATPSVAILEDYIVNISCDIPELLDLPETTIYYDLGDGEKIYEGPFKLTKGGIFTTWAKRDGWIASGNSSYDFTGFQTLPPTIIWNPDEKKVSIEHEDPDVIIYYTLDGSDPNVNCAHYSEPIELTKNTGIKAIATKAKLLDSEITEETISDFITEFEIDDIYYSLAGNMIDEVVISDGKQKSGHLTIYSNVSYSGIPFKVIGIGTEAFKENDEILSITLPNTLLTIDSHAFYSCENLEQVSFNEGLKTIGTYAFRGCKLTSAIIPETVNSIGSGCFSDCAYLKTVKLPKALNKIESWLFSGCPITNIDIPDNVKQIGELAFVNCSKLVSITIPDGVQSLKQVFQGCSSLTTVKLPNSIQKLDYAFSFCYSLKSIVIPENVTNIRGCFRGCNALSSIYCLAKVPPTVENYQTFENVDYNQTSLFVYSDALDLYKNTNYWSSFTNVYSLDLPLCTQPTICSNQIAITITCVDPVDATIYYTLDGTKPTIKSKKYNGSFNLVGNCTIKAIAVADNYNDSPVSTYVWDRASDFTCKEPQISRYAIDKDGSAHLTSDSLFINSQTDSVTFYYTIDGSTPTIQSLKYTNSIKTLGNGTVKVIAVKENMFNSPVVELYVNWLTVAVPKIDFMGKFCSITTETEGATIFYTRDESEPTSKSSIYKGRFAMPNQQAIVKAMAMREDWNDSEIRTRTYFPGGYTCEEPVIVHVVGTDSIIINTRTEGATIYYTTSGLNPTISDQLYEKPFVISQNGNLKAIAVHPLYYDSEVASFNVNWFKAEQPVITVDGKYVSITCKDSTAVIHYTLNGTDPTEEDLVYSDRLAMSESCIVKAIATRSDLNNSTVARYDYRTGDHDCGTPEFTRTGNQVTISATPEDNTTIYYTLDESIPTTKSEIFSRPIEVSENLTIKAIATNPHFFQSEVGTFEVNWFKTETPVISYNGVIASISCTTPDAAIYYTIDGTTPTEESLRYSKSITLTSSCTVKAIAMRENYKASTVATSWFDRSEYMAVTPQFQRKDSTVVILSSDLEGTVVYYTLDGAEPTTASDIYTEPIPVTGNCTVKVMVTQPNLFPSETAVYEVNWFKVETPVIAFDGTNTNITCATPNARIYYTLDGSAPTEESLRYLKSFSMTSSGTIKAIAIKENYYNSAVVSVAFDKAEYTAGNPLFQVTDSIVTITSESLEGTTIYYTTDGTEPSIVSNVYSEPIKLDGNCTLKAIAMNPKMFTSGVSIQEVNWFKVETPAINFDGTNTNITCATPNAKIYYTLDGTNPSEESLRYMKSFTMTNSGTIKAIALKENYITSTVASVAFDKAEYTAGTPMFQVTDNAIAITSESLDGTVIYYTTDGTEPNAVSNVYNGPLVLDGNCTLKAIAMNPKMFNSEVATYDVNWYKVETPVISFDGTISQITCATPNAKIFYTVDGSNPTEESLQYESSITMTESCTVKAIAAKTNYNNSTVASVAFNKEDNTASEPLFQRTDSVITITSATTKEGTIIYYTLDGTNPNVTSDVYSEPLKMVGNCTLKAITMNPKMFNSIISTYEVNWYKVETPVISFDGTITTITCATPNARIYYTTDGTNPTEESLKYDNAFPMTETCTVKAIAAKANYNYSAIASVAFNKDENSAGKPLFARNGNVITITPATMIEGTVIYYTLDGTEPTSVSNVYNEPISVAGNCTLKAIAMVPKKFDSDVATYDVNWFKVETPVVTFDGYNVTIDCATPNSRIYYSLDGTTPTEESLRYTETLAMTESCTIKAIAVRENYNNSTVVTNTFDKDGNTVGRPKFTRNGNVISIASSTSEGVTIYYTTDGTEPTIESAVYSEPITVSENCIFKALATKAKQFNSETISYDVDWFKVETPVLLVDGTRVTMTCNTPDATIYYAYDEDPTATSAIYSEPLTLTDNREIHAYAVRKNYYSSEVATYAPDMFVCEAVTFSYNGRYLQMQTGEGMTIRYTTDGSKPTSESEICTGILEISQLCTVRTIATRKDFRDSPETSYTVDYLYNGEEANLNEAGKLEEVFQWIGGTENLETLPVKGKINNDDLAFIRGVKSLRHLDLSAATYESNHIPDEAFADLPLLTISIPKQITSVGEHLFKGCKNLAAIVWNADLTIPQSVIDDITNPNLLLYVNSRIYVPNSYKGNLISGGQATNIVLTDAEEGSNFCCPQQFFTQQISYTHNYSQTTKSGSTQGWETLALPFDVQTITHETRGTLAPFARGEEVTVFRPFWLYELQATGFTRAAEIKAYTPYIVSMPNDPDYADDYILAGNVTFSSADVYIEADTSRVTMKGSVQFSPSMQHQPSSATILTINKEDCTDDEGVPHVHGSAFLSRIRDVRPFEAYALIDAAGVKAMLVGDYLWGGATDIRDAEMKQLKDLGKNKGIYDMSGKLLSPDSNYFKEKLQHRNIFIINGQKTRVK